MQEREPGRGLLGEVATIYTGTDPGLTEASHRFQRDGWYYLTTAEGGTGCDHAITMARSRDICGPCETHPQKHLITARPAPENPVQRIGHGQYVEGHDSRHWHSHLCGRPQQGPRGAFCATGRETGLAKVVWRDGWLWLKDGGTLPPAETALPALRLVPDPVPRDFPGPVLPPEFQWLRTPHPDRLFSLTGQGLRLIGRESLGLWFEQSLVARRQDKPACDAEADFTADPPNWQRAAGLISC